MEYYDEDNPSEGEYDRMEKLYYFDFPVYVKGK